LIQPLLPESELLKNAQVFEYYDIHQSLQKIELTKGSLAYTICQVPIIYKKDGDATITLIFNDLSTKTIDGNSLSKEYSDAIFQSFR
jgi:hypothetical protein